MRSIFVRVEPTVRLVTGARLIELLIGLALEFFRLARDICAGLAAIFHRVFDGGL